MTALGVGIVGMGFMGRTHLRAWSEVAAVSGGCRVVAVADRHPRRREGWAESTGNAVGARGDGRLFDPAEVTGHPTFAALLADPAVDIVSLCTPTDTHVELALEALAAGKHVLLEKPIALRSADVATLVAAAEDAAGLCMPAMCIRFWPAWEWLITTIRERPYGPLQSLSIERLGDIPSWSQHFYGDPQRSGGALVDLHIHDTDFILAALGPPTTVTSAGHPHHVTTIYRFEDGPSHVVATGGWIPGVTFRMTFLAVFERGTFAYRFGAAPELARLQVGSEPDAVALDGHDGYFHQCARLLTCIRQGTPLPVTLRDAWDTARVLEAERQSQLTGHPIPLWAPA